MDRKIRKCIGYNEMPALQIADKEVCTATHPSQPNHSGGSRGRKIHLAKDENLTICNLKIDKYIPDNGQSYSPMSNGKCKICFKGVESYG